MSRSSTATTSKIPPQFPSKSAWARGPPQQVATATSRPQSPALTTPITPTTPSTSNNFHGSHSRRPSTLGQGVSIKDGVGVTVPRNNVGAAKQGSAAVTFGSIDDAAAPISSSPASAPVAKPVDGVKSFGTVAVQNGVTTAASKSVLMTRSSSLASTTAPTTTTTPSSTTSSTPKFDVTKLFQGPSVTTPSVSDTPTSRPSNLPPPPHQSGPGQYGPPSFTPSSALRPQTNDNTNGGPPRSPSYTRSMGNNGTSGGVGVSGRPPSGPGPGTAPAAMPSPRLASHPPAPGAPPAGMPPAGVWPGYYSYYAPPPDQYYSPNWVPQPLPPHMHPQQPPLHQSQGAPGPAPAVMPMSPRNPPPPLQQPGTPTSNHSAPSPAHTQPHGPPSHIPPPTVTSPPPTPSTTNGPAGARLNTNASAFVPGKKISIKNKEGLEVDLGALKRSGQSPVQGLSHAPSPIVIKQESKRQSIRIESPEQKEKRIADEQRAKEKEEAAKKAKEAKEAKEREDQELERKQAEERKEKERRQAEERVEKERQKKEAEEKQRLEEEERAKKEAEERKRQEEEKRVAEEQEKVRAEAERLKKLEEEKRAAEAKALDEAKAKAAAEASGKEEGEIDETTESKPSEGHQAKSVEKEGLRIDTAIPSPETRRRPGPLDLKNINANIPASLPSALATARIIEDLGHVAYPEGIKSPKVELNVNAAKGKFRYDRDFLLQFMSICKEKPDNLPPLDAIGLEPSDQTFSMSRGGSGRRSSTMATPTARQASIGLGFMGGGSMGKSTGSSFAGMGNFTTTKLSSEERFAMSSGARSALSNSVGPGVSTSGRPSPMARTASQGGSSKDRQRTRSTRGTTRDNSNRASVAGHPSQTPSNMGPPLEHIAPLEQSANRWVPISSKRSQPVETDSPEIVDRKVKGLLNKLTMERFDSISDQIIEWANKSEREKDGRTLIQVIRLVFEKATDEATFSEMYARLCRKMMEQISAKVQDDGILNQEGKPFAGGQLFRKYLLNRCQEDFERGWVAKETAAAAAAVKATEDQAVKDANETAGKKEAAGEAELYSDEYYAAAKAKRRGLGLIRFIGELFKLQMLTERIMHECIKKLLSNVENPEEEEIESLCKLLTTVGQMIDTPKARAHMDVYFSRMKELTKSKSVNSRMTFMLQDVVELREMKWVARNQVAAPATLAQVHEAAAKEKAAAEKESFNRQSNMSRGGSRRGGDRNDGSVIGPDGWSVAGSGPPRPPPKAGDLSNFGKISKAAPMTFGPSGIFAGKKEAKGREASVSRTASSTNMFSMLSNADAAAEAAAPKPSRPPSRKPSVDLSQPGGVPETTQRRKLQLLPRSRPVDDSKASDMTEDAESEDGSVAAGPSMTEEEAKRKIGEDVKEFFGVRSLDEAESYFSSLPPEHRFRLVDTLAMQGIDGKAADIPLIADLFTRAREKDLCSPAAFEEGFAQLAELVDDLAIDIPKAFDTFAQWIKAAGLDKDEEARTRLAGKVPESGDRLLGLLA
ncbi:hypothetical protein OF83DRAFT_1271296 [Amylostereum chailletii]|nr:hypothetical protein OF83DRAFT_1271296 [Amylostereum chailletii]